MAIQVLTDTLKGHFRESLELHSSEFAPPQAHTWSVSKKRLHGGRSDGVDLITVDNGRLQFAIVPTRGMGLWSAHFGSDRVGWLPPIVDGPVNPAFVELSARGGLGWLQGFNELMARCGLESNGPPTFDDMGRLVHGLHGRIANIPAHFLAVRVADSPPGTISIEGIVDETELFSAQLRLSTSISTTPGSNRLTIRDEIINRHDVPAGFQLLYHWNFGSPQLDEGARFVAPVKTVCPRDARAAQGIDQYDVFGPPQSGFAEQVYYFTLHPGIDGTSLVLLRNRAGDKGVALRFMVSQLPCFTLWKCTQGMREGYVAGLEPGVNFPNPYPFEQSHGRVLTLQPGSAHTAETVLEALDNRQEIEAVEAEIAALQQQAAPLIHANPVEPFAPEA